MTMSTNVTSLLLFLNSLTTVHYVVLFIFSSFFIIILYYIIRFLVLCWKLRKFKGPPAYPFVGNCYTAESLVFLKYLARLRAKYGKVYTFFKFSRAYLVICDPIIVRRILSDSKTIYKGKDETNKCTIMFGTSLTTVNGEKHVMIRDIFEKICFSSSKINEFCLKINSLTDTVFDEYLSSSISSTFPTSSMLSSKTMHQIGKDGKYLNVEPILSRLLLRVFLSFAVSEDLSHDLQLESKLCYRISASNYAIGRLIAFNEPNWSFLPDMQYVDKAKQLIWKVLRYFLEKRKSSFHEIISSAAEERRQQQKEGTQQVMPLRPEEKKEGDQQQSQQLRQEGRQPPNDLLQAMIMAGLNDKEVFNNFSTLFCLSHDKSVYFLSFLIYLLSKYPDIQEKLYSHVQQVLREKSNSSKYGTSSAAAASAAEVKEKEKERESITADDFARMTYLHCVMMETLRLYAIVPGITRTATEEIHVKEANITIPKGSHLLIPMVVINRDPEVWENPSEFRPERFEEKSINQDIHGILNNDNGKATSSPLSYGIDFTSARDGFFPFGYGSRTCLGSTLGQLEVAIILCKLMKRFIIEPDPLFRISIRSGISLTTFNGINVKLRPR
jgi:cytochrome P450